MTTAAACRVERLRLHSFRNYIEQTVELGAGLTVISGRNAQGKTTLLEAIATLALTRSPRAAGAAELIRWGDAGCAVQAIVRRPDGPVELDMRIERSPTDPGRAVRRTLVDGKERPARALLGICPVVLFWPEDLLLVKGGPEARRRLLDVVLSQLDPRAAFDLVRYRRVLDQRNALLRQIRLGTESPAALPGFTAELVVTGGRVQVARAALVAELAGLASSALAELSDGDEQLTLGYAPAGLDGIPTDPVAAAAALERALAARAAEETARGMTLLGPHRDDVEMRLDGRPARVAASQGQQRSIVLALKLAEVRHVASVARMAPVLLLDDVLSELDAGRRGRLLDGLGNSASGGQALLTTSEARVDLPSLGAVRRLVVESGRVTAAPAGAGDAVA